MTIILSLLVVAWLPGAVLFRAPWGNRDRRASLGADERAFWAVVLSVAASLAIVLALAAAHRYSFRRLMIADLSIAAAIALAARLRLRLGAAARLPGPTTLIPIGLILIGCWRFFPPAEYIIGGKDPGVYMNEGIQIAQRGALVINDQLVASLPPFARDLFIPSHERRDYYSLRFMGFFVRAPDQGLVVGQFPHLFPASIAIGYGIDGLTGARRTSGIWAILGVLAVYFAGARLLGKPAAAAGALLLALNATEVFFARYPNAELVMQALLFAALLANARAQVDGDAFFAPVAGALLGLLLFLRIDSLIAIASVGAGLTLGYIAGQRLRWTFWLPLIVAVALCSWYLLGPMRAYFELPRVFISYLAWWQQGLIAAGVIVAAVLWLAASRTRAISDRVVAWTPTLLATTVVFLAIYALYFRQPGGKLAAYDAYALRTFAVYYVTTPALIAALVGYVLVSRALFWRDPAFLFTIAAFALFFFYKLHIVPVHFWMGRRFLPVILPATLLLAGGAALTGVRGRLLVTRAIRGPIGVVFLALLANDYLRVAKPVLAHVEYAGVIPKLEQLASHIGADNLVVVESRDTSNVHLLALPLAYIYAKNLLVLASAAPDKPTFNAFLEWAQTRYHRVLFMGAGGSDLLSSKWNVEPTSSDRFQVPEYEITSDRYPRGARDMKFDYTMYAFTPAQGRRPFDLDVGLNDDLNVLRFNARERTEGRTFRWSQDQSFLIVTDMTAQDRTLAMWMSNGGRPAAASPAAVTVLVGDRPLGTMRVGDGFAEYDFSIPADVAASAAARGEPVRVTIRTTLWNPQQTLGTEDDRDLGVMVDRVAVR
jgi:hypothetical protein